MGSSIAVSPELGTNSPLRCSKSMSPRTFSVSNAAKEEWLAYNSKAALSVRVRWCLKANSSAVMPAFAKSIHPAPESPAFWTVSSPDSMASPPYIDRGSRPERTVRCSSAGLKFTVPLMPSTKGISCPSSALFSKATNGPMMLSGKKINDSPTTWAFRKSISPAPRKPEPSRLKAEVNMAFPL